MKKGWGVGIVVLLAAGLGVASLATAQGELDRLESGIRTSNGLPAMAVAAPQHAYLGAVAENDAGRGVILLSVRSGGPADHAGLQAHDLIIGAAGRKIRLLSELSVILNNLNPGDRLALEFLRGNKPLRAEVVLGAPPGAAIAGPPGAPPPTGLSAGRTETIPPPPGEETLAPSPQGPALQGVPDSQPVPPNSPQAQIDELRRRVDRLERRVQELERALAESRRK
ncbi:MAG: PDZ domain-containing protein [Thermoguttaceae bacterium]